MTTPKLIIIIAKLRLMISSGIRRLKASVSSRDRIVEITEKNKTPKVTVLIPPAVPAGEPPINIRIIGYEL